MNMVVFGIILVATIFLLIGATAIFFPKMCVNILVWKTEKIMGARLIPSKKTETFFKVLGGFFAIIGLFVLYLHLFLGRT